MKNTEEMPFQIVCYNGRFDPEETMELVHSARSPYELLGWAMLELKVSWLDRRIYTIRDARTGVLCYDAFDCGELDNIVEMAQDVNHDEAYSPNRVVWG